jgi:hypothetical protein
MTHPDPAAHNEAVASLWDDYAHERNDRVPICFASDESLWLRLTGRSYRGFYTDPRAQLDVTLAGLAWLAENIVHDQAIGLPDAWMVAPRFWMDEAEFFGCPVRLQDDSYAWAVPLPDAKADLLARLRDLDAAERIQATSLWRLWTAMAEIADGMTCRDRPVRVTVPAGGSHGIFTVACHVRGVEALCQDLVEDPDFASELIGLIADKTYERIVAWLRLAGQEPAYPSAAGWGLCDDALQLISPAAYRRCILPHHQRLYAAMTTGPRHIHLCGRSAQHFRTLYEELGITTLDGPGPFVDHGALLAAMPGLRINAQADHTVLLLGPEGAIRAMVEGLLSPAARQPGRMNVMGFIGPATPPAHLRAMYEAGLAFGRIAQAAAGV